MNDWRECNLGDVLTIKYGKDHKALSDGNIPVYGSGGIMRHADTAIYEGESVLIPRKGSLNNIFYVNKPFWTVDTMFWSVIDKSIAIPLFLYYQLKLIDYMRLNVGSAVPSLTIPVINEIDIKIPSLLEQKAITAVLASLDDKIDLLHRQNKTLEALAQTLFRHWFIDNADDDWEDGTMNNALTAVGGTTPSTKNPDFWDGDIHWTTPRDLSNNDGPYLLDTARKITKSGLAKIGSGLLPKGTLLLSSRAPVGYLGFSEVPIAINQGYIAILDNKGFSKHFIYLWLKENMDYVKSYAGGTTFMEISKSSFRTLEITTPPVRLREAFEEIVILLFEKIRTNSHQIRTLEKLRDTLLPKLMSGEVRVRL